MGSIWNPDLYHGFNKNKNYFEGWYYKLTDRSSKHVIAFIPGIIRGNSDHNHEAFLQVLDGRNNTSSYISFGVDSFKAKKNEFLVYLEHNEFSLNHIKLNYYDKQTQLLGELKFVDIVRWPDSKLSPGSMGFYNYIPFMECYSQVSCLYGEVVGKILINNEEIDFSGGKVYIEKNWGKSFPKAYLWVQSMDFAYPGVSFTCSIGRVPFMGFNFNGFLASFLYQDNVYKFTTMNRAKLQMENYYNQINLTFNHNDIQLNVTGTYKQSEMINCKGPVLGEMSLPVHESLTSQIKVELKDTFKNKILFTGIGENAGIELLGDLSPESKS